METKVGVWLDHRKAVVVTVAEDGLKTTVIESNVEKHIRAADPSMKGPFKARQVPADDKQEREFTEHINIYYTRIIEKICNAGAILIFGPGEAKNELKKQLEKNNLAGRICGVETTDKMTDHQIQAKVHDYFQDDFVSAEDMESPHQRLKVKKAPSIHI